MTDPNYLLLGEAEPFEDDDSITVQPRAGDVCRLRNQDDLWIPYGGIGNIEEHGRVRFARYPNCDRVQVFDLADVCDVVLPCEHEFARDAWEVVSRKFPDGGGFERKFFVFRAHEGHCSTLVYDAAGTLIAHGLLEGMAAVRHFVEITLANLSDIEVVWCIGRAALEEHIRSGALRGVDFADPA